MRKILLAIALCIVLPTSAYCALSSSTAWEVRTNGNNNNGGGFVTGGSGTDYSQQDSAEYTATDLEINSGDNTIVGSATHSFIASDVDNLMQITAGTGFTPGFYQIYSVSGGSATLDRACGTVESTGGTYAVGGALRNIDYHHLVMVAGNTTWIKADATYSRSSYIDLNDVAGTNALPLSFTGYTTTRGDGGQATISFTAGNYYIYAFNDYINMSNLIITGSTTTRLMQTKEFFQGRNLKLVQGTSSAIAVQVLEDNNVFIDCEFSAPSGTCIETGVGATFFHRFVGCYFHDSSLGISEADYASDIINCIFDTCTKAVVIRRWGNVIGSTFYNGTTAIEIATGTAAVRAIILNNIFHTFTNGINEIDTIGTHIFDYNNYYTITNKTTNTPIGANSIELDPEFTDAPNGDFSVGDNMKAVGFPGTYPGGLSTGYLDIGAVQREEPASGGGETSYGFIN